jgi:deoxyribodipyrimidine photo-lyase
MSYRVVWFKRDLRVHDHAPLAHAVRQGPVLCLYVVEPSLWQQPDAAAQHYHFICESLADLAAQLRPLGLPLHVAVGEAVDVLDRLHHCAPFHGLHSHEETGNGHTYARDRAVARWCRERGVVWHESPQFGVVRRLHDRRLWQPRWEAFMAQAQATLSDARPPGCTPSVHFTHDAFRDRSQPLVAPRPACGTNPGTGRLGPAPPPAGWTPARLGGAG